MPAVVREAVIKLGLEQIDAELAPPSLTPHIQQVEDLGDQTKQTSAAIQQANAEITESNIRAAEGFRTAGEGAFTMARGVALLGSSSEDDLQKMRRTIAQIQGGFDIFKGGIDVIKGVREATASWSAAQSAATATTSGLAATSGRLAGVLGTAAGPWGIGVTAALATGVTAWRLWADASEDAATRAKRAVDDAAFAIESQTDSLKRHSRLQDTLRGFEEPQAQIASIDEELAELGAPKTSEQIEAEVLEGLRADKLAVSLR